MAPKPAGPGLTEAEVVTVFNRIMDRLILISKQKYAAIGGSYPYPYPCPYPYHQPSSPSP
jgi:hypothetical protein